MSCLLEFVGASQQHHALQTVRQLDKSESYRSQQMKQCQIATEISIIQCEAYLSANKDGGQEFEMIGRSEV